MARTGRLLRASVVIWLIIQMAAYAAVLRRDCCAPGGTERFKCHEQAAAAQCPMRGADGTPCPMHRQGGASQHAGHDVPADANDCVVRGTCTGPVAAFLTLLTTPALIPPASTAAILPRVARSDAPVLNSAIARPEPPDPPPPRG